MKNYTLMFHIFFNSAKQIFSQLENDLHFHHYKLMFPKPATSIHSKLESFKFFLQMNTIMQNLMQNMISMMSKFIIPTIKAFTV